MSNEHEHKEHHSEHHTHHAPKPKSSFSWNVIGLVLVLVLVAAVASTYVGFMAGQSSAKGGANAALLEKGVESYINTNLLTDKTLSATIADANSMGEFYKMGYKIIQNGNQVFAGDVFSNGTTLIIGQAFEMDKPLPTPQQQQQASAEPEKAAKATADLYIFSYCPAGTATLESFAKTADLLKEVANVKVKFFSNMHGTHELQQNKIQACIQQVDSNKYWTYAQKFVEQIYPVCGTTRDVACDKNESIKLMNSLGIDSNKVMDCVATQGEALYQSDIADATALQLQYSPSVVINGTYVGNADRSPEGLKTLICNGFTNAPSECSTALSATTTASSGSCH